MKDNSVVIEVVIPNWNGIHLLVHCLGSLRRQTLQDFSITIVDNGSTDGSVQKLERDYPEIKVIKFFNNKGFSAAVNAGIKDSSSDWILLLNNDMEVHPQCLQVLHEHIIKNTPYDFFALCMLDFHSRNVLDGAGDGFLRGGVGYRIGTMEKYGPPYNTDREVFGACAGAALYKKELFDKVGLFDEDFFAYLEDVDLNLRAIHAGCRCYYLSSAIVYHMGSATSGSKINPLTVRLSTKNNFNVLVKNYPLSLYFRFFPAILIYQLFWFLFVIKKRKIFPYFQGIIQAVHQLPKTLKKRARILSGSSLTIEQFAKSLIFSEKDVIASIMARRKEQGKGNWLFMVYCKIFL
jgi:GT2 family glycosyltransferase